jgi:hypothetical protein
MAPSLPWRRSRRVSAPARRYGGKRSQRRPGLRVATARAVVIRMSRSVNGALPLARLAPHGLGPWRNRRSRPDRTACVRECCGAGDGHLRAWPTPALLCRPAIHPPRTPRRWCRVATASMTGRTVRCRGAGIEPLQARPRATHGQPQRRPSRSWICSRRQTSGRRCFGYHQGPPLPPGGGATGANLRSHHLPTSSDSP